MMRSSNDTQRFFFFEVCVLYRVMGRVADCVLKMYTVRGKEVAPAVLYHC